MREILAAAARRESLRLSKAATVRCWQVQYHLFYRPIAKSGEALLRLVLVRRQIGTIMLASVFIIIISSALFLSWFRYLSLLFIHHGNAEYALKVAATIRLSFPQVQKTLQGESHLVVIDSLNESLENDYHVLTDLLRHSADTDSIGRQILTIDYKLLRVWYRLSMISHSFLRARKILAEMSSILSYFAAEIGENSLS